jgi:hypothetical protein
MKSIKSYIKSVILKLSGKLKNKAIKIYNKLNPIKVRIKKFYNFYNGVMSVNYSVSVNGVYVYSSDDIKKAEEVFNAIVDLKEDVSKYQVVKEIDIPRDLFAV